MRVLVVGCGSIGSRRARLLAEMGHDVLCHDSDERRVMASMGVGFSGAGGRIRGLLGSRGRSAMDLAVRPWEAVFICTPAATHVPLAVEYLSDGKDVFIEKPLSVSMDGVQELIDAVKRTGRIAMGACNMRWAYGDNAFAFVRAALQKCGGYPAFGVRKPLSTWRPSAEAAYRDNGIALEMAIHEIDLAVHLFGRIDRIDVERSTPDYLGVRLFHESGVCSVVEARWDEASDDVRFIAVCPDGPACTPDTSDEMYRLEMAHFLDCVKNRTQPCNTVEDAAHVLEWAIKARDPTQMEEAC